MTDLAIIGGGAAGLAAAVTAHECGDRVTIFEQGNTIGRKIAASGNGRCNLMNSGTPRFYGDAAFAEKVLGHCPQKRLTRYWRYLGIYLNEETEGRMYPSTFRSGTVNDAYRIRLKSVGTTVLLQTRISEIRKEGKIFRIFSDDREYTASRVLIACGGAASPKLGGNDSGYRLLRSFGHNVISPAPALCPLKTDAKSICGLAGIRVKCRASLKDVNGKTLRSEQGEALFTENGISGICIMQLSRFASAGSRIELDLLHRVFSDQDELCKELLKRQEYTEMFAPETLLSSILAPKLSYAVLKQAGIEMKNRKAGDLTPGEIRTIADRCRKYTVYVAGSCGLEEAQVTAGGADCTMFDPETMQSSLVDGLFAAGEVLNVDGDCGGYNLMFATASGILAGLNGRKETVI